MSELKPKQLLKASLVGYSLTIKLFQLRKRHYRPRIGARTKTKWYMANTLIGNTTLNQVRRMLQLSKSLSQPSKEMRDG
jgi:hypothetical protein